MAWIGIQKIGATGLCSKSVENRQALPKSHILPSGTQILEAILMQPPPRSSTPGTLFVSVVIPAYNEERRLGNTLQAVKKYLASADFQYEVIIVDDGSIDRTASIAEHADVPGLRVLKNPGNQGKGYTVRHGIEQATGDIILFTDADNSTPIEEFETLRPHFDNGADIVIGSRALPQSQLQVRQTALREFAGRTFNWLLRLLVNLPFHDTQCGFKAFRREAAQAVFPHQSIRGWGFDAEVLLIARRQGLRIVETPVHWINSPDSRLSIWRDAPKMLLEVLKIRLNDLRGRYK